MPRPYVTLAERPTDMVRLACTKCERRGQYRKATLIERYGADANMVELRLILAADCPKVAANRMMDLCGVIWRILVFSDASVVDRGVSLSRHRGTRARARERCRISVWREA
jgi:hypothetical protein